MEKVKSILKNTAAMVGVLSVLGGIAWKAFDLDSRSFSSMEMRVQTEREISEGPTAEERQRQRILDSVNAVHAMRSRQHRDSVLDEILLRQIHQDSINLLNADQMYQIKEQLKPNR